MTQRYHLCPVADADCTELHDPIALLSELADARHLWGRLHGRHHYGLAIKDTETGLIDWGHGFGVPIPEIDP